MPARSARRQSGATPEQAFGQVLKQIRQQKGISQEALAEACDRHSTYISMLERGVKSPTIRTVYAIAAALEVKPRDIFRRVDKLLSL